PIYMIPATFVRLQAFPLTTNGKIDRRALPQPDDARLETERPFTPPRTPAEETLTNIFSRVLNVARVGIDDNYFELGGDSIRSIQVLSQARQAGLNFSLADLFNLQTVARLCEQIARSDIVEAAVEATEAAPFSLISDADRTKLPASVEDAYPLSKLQAGMLFHAELEAETAVYHNVKSWHIQAVFNGEMLKTAVQQLAQKHTVLRSGFDFSSYSEPLQLVWSQVQIPVNLHDLRHLDDNGQEAEIGRWVKQAIAKKFDWTQPPLLRFRFLQRSDNSFQMIMVEHHAILDGWSVASLLTELLQTYHGLLAGTAVSTAESVPYRNFVAAEQKMLASAAARTFWQERLAESNISTIPRLPLPKNDEELLETDTATGSMQTVYQTIIPKEQVTKLNQVAQRAGVPLKSVLLAAHLKVLGFVSGQNDVMSGLVMNGRTEQSGSERALGLFLNTVPVRQKLAAGSWLDLIRQTFASEKAILPYRRFPLAEMQQMLGGQPLFEVPFNFLHFHVLDAIDNEITILNEQFFGHTNFALAVEVELNSADGTLA
ncbi:MAG: non-ribosomal peptide synthetase, partial [Chloroflexi bacterium]|nr:non-ribosomal peptide synthetase [Chloroflexota bacterium]